MRLSLFKWRAHFYSDAAWLLYLLKKQIKSHQTFSIYGAGELGQDLYFRALANNLTADFWFDKIAQVKPFSVFDFDIQSPQQLDAKQFDYIVIASNAYLSEIKNFLLEQGVQPSQIIGLDLC
ncbi:hypothetical protein N7931_03765 [Catenovulum sp. 2E275]|uniref:hypothetical protein n=1 Tax=Catenovulum sp. 2E275 TaxID=2980497 RepID=UPI0021CE2ED1|nr:hypothetical protein [Catenovulum sp. 2E275]MCU4674744.1 hypothetical protein [Catenovulum sp. 2E275]